MSWKWILTARIKGVLCEGLRNAVGLRWIKGGLFATNMGSDHLGDHKPADTMYRSTRKKLRLALLLSIRGCALSYPKFNAGSKKLNCREVPQAFAAFDAHSSPLGLEFFDSIDLGPVPKSGEGDPLRDSFLIALHRSRQREGLMGAIASSGSSKAASPEILRKTSSIVFVSR